MESVTLKFVYERMVEQMADNMFVSEIHHRKGNEDISRTLRIKAIGIADMGHEQFGFDSKKMHEQAYNTYKTRVEFFLEGGSKK